MCGSCSENVEELRRGFLLTNLNGKRSFLRNLSIVLAKLSFNSNGGRHGQVFAILTYFESTGQLPIHEGED